MPEKRVTLQLRLPPELHDEIKRLTTEEDRPLNRTIIRLLRVGLEHYRTEGARPDDRDRNVE